MPDPASDFDALVEEFYPVWFRYRPDLGRIAGIPGDGRLPAQDDDELEALAGWLGSLLLGLDEVDCPALDPDRRLDYAVMAGVARVEHRELRAFDWRRRDPLRFLPLEEIHRLTLGPGEGMREWLAQILGRIPEHLRHAQAELRAAGASVAPILVRAAAGEAEAGRCYLRELIRGPWLRAHCHGLVELESLAERACDALADFGADLMEELLPRAGGQPGCGEVHLMLRLRELHFMDTEEEGARAALARGLSRIEEELRRCPTPAPAIADAPSREASRQGLVTHAPDAASLCEGLRLEIESSGLVTLPEAALRIVTRTQCPGPQRIGVSYLPQDAGFGTLYLPAAGGSHGTGGPESLRALCLAGGWGGAHLLAFANPRKAARMPRRLANGGSLRTAWHLYLDRLLAEQVTSDTERRRASLARRCDCLRLAQLDLDLHLARVDTAGALARLAALGFVGAWGEARLAQMARHPGDALAGALGWLILESARAELERAGFSPRAFHDRLLAEGAVPLPLALGAACGENLWDRAWDRVFGG